MSNGPIHPSTIDGIKRYAKTLKISQGLTHAKALDAAATAGGFQNYIHARRKLEGAVASSSAHLAYISVSWRVRLSNEVISEGGRGTNSARGLRRSGTCLPARYFSKRTTEPHSSELVRSSETCAPRHELELCHNMFLLFSGSNANERRARIDSRSPINSAVT